MNKSIRLLAVCAVALAFAIGCGSTTEETKVSRTNTYVPIAPPVVVAPPPVVMSSPPPATTTSSTEEKRSDSYSSNSGDAMENESERANSSYHSETTA